FHFRRPAPRSPRIAVHPVLSAAQSECRLLGGADVEGRGDVSNWQGSASHRAHAADDGACRGRHGVSRIWTETPGDAASGHPLSSAARIGILAIVIVRLVITKREIMFRSCCFLAVLATVAPAVAL